MKILIVDDSMAMATLIRKILESRLVDDVDIDLCTRSSDVPSLVSEQPYDAVVTDIYMPRMDGYEVIQYLKRTNPNMIFMAMSGFVA